MRQHHLSLLALPRELLISSILQRLNPGDLNRLRIVNKAFNELIHANAGRLPRLHAAELSFRRVELILPHTSPATQLSPHRQQLNGGGLRRARKALQPSNRAGLICKRRKKGGKPPYPPYPSSSIVLPDRVDALQISLKLGPGRAAKTRLIPTTPSTQSPPSILSQWVSFFAERFYTIGCMSLESLDISPTLLHQSLLPLAASGAFTTSLSFTFCRFDQGPENHPLSIHRLDKSGVRAYGKEAKLQLCVEFCYGAIDQLIRDEVLTRIPSLRSLVYQPRQMPSGESFPYQQPSIASELGINPTYMLERYTAIFQC